MRRQNHGDGPGHDRVIDARVIDVDSRDADDGG